MITSHFKRKVYIHQRDALKGICLAFYTLQWSDTSHSLQNQERGHNPISHRDLECLQGSELVFHFPCGCLQSSNFTGPDAA